ncbi:hypothetical protein J4212_06290 [Candidatus Woesearchaeota archaeon]|nr:hypothetical protein [Candidatus Woesearchaeota archaeon]
MPPKGWKEEFEKFRIIQKCPRCGSLALSFVDGKLLCGECGFEQNIGQIK